MNVKVLAAIALTVIVAMPIGLGYMMNINEVSYNEYEQNGTTNITDMINNSTSDVFTLYTGIDNNKLCNDGGVPMSLDFVTSGSTYTSVYKYTVTSTSTSNLPAGNTTLTSSYYWKFVISNNYCRGYGWTDSGGNSHFNAIAATAPATNVTFERLATGFYMDSFDYPIAPLDVTNFYVYLITSGPGTTSFLSAKYAYQAAGWHAPGTPGTPKSTDYWYNVQNNQSITMMVDLKETSQTYLYPRHGGSSSYGKQALGIDKEASGNVKVYTTDSNGAIIESDDLGNYEYVRLTIGSDNKVLVEGLSRWPSFNDKINAINSFELTADFKTNGQPINQINFTQPGTNTGANIFRVDSTSIKSGTYPVVNNGTINPQVLNPNLVNSEMKISNVMIPGSSITFAGETFTVSSNKTINVSGYTVNVDGATFRSVTEDGVTWSHYIDGHLVDQSGSISSIDLNGTWSAIYKLSNLDMSSVTRDQWQAGSFAFDQETFALVGLITCGLATIGLGLYGIRSGTKMLWLMLVTGGAALIFMFMI